MNTNRLEAFSDGVLAVAITLLVLNITVPPASRTPDLGHALLAQWQIYAAYATSFITIGIIWMNHHAMIGRLRQADHAILFWNLLLLMSVGVLPFATSLMAAYVKEGHGASHLAAAIYSGSLLVMSLMFTALNRQILIVRSHLLDESLSEARRRLIFKRALIGIMPYVIAIALAPVSAYATLAICAAVAAYYATPLASGMQANDPA
ncbi:MAG TPA: TMEM175 family protein [Solirubrobacteraceae bacterium]|nr:TMEM175 family protein [Solirubrobacteraceae bacterium]